MLKTEHFHLFIWKIFEKHLSLRIKTARERFRCRYNLSVMSGGLVPAVMMMCVL